MNLPRRAVVRPLTSCLAAAALAAAALVPVAASATPAPTARSGSVAASAAAATTSVAAVRAVTPPRAVTKKQLVRIFRAAARATDVGLRRGASLRSVQEMKGQRTVGTGRARAGLVQVRDSSGAATILDARTGSSFVSLAGLRDSLGVTEAELDAALATLGKPGATWAELASGPAQGGVLGQSLVGAAKAATAWSWTRSKGLTTWRLTSERRVFRSTFRSTQVFVLDSRQRLVRQSETTVSSSPRVTVRSTLTFRYRSVAPIVPPAPAQTVDFTALLRLLLGTPGGA